MSIGPQQPVFPDEAERITRLKELSSSAASRVHLVQRTLPTPPIRDAEEALADGSDRADLSGQDNERAVLPVEDSESSGERNGSNSPDHESAAGSELPPDDSESDEAEEDCGANLNLRY